MNLLKKAAAIDAAECQRLVAWGIQHGKIKPSPAYLVQKAIKAGRIQPPEPPPPPPSPKEDIALKIAALKSFRKQWQATGTA